VTAPGVPEGYRTLSPYLVVSEDSDAVYGRALAAGATSVAEPHDTSFGDHRSAFDDPWGNQWWEATRRGSSASP
jgi:uncharacterized glyoxalase superfamily protein PhnB